MISLFLLNFSVDNFHSHTVHLDIIKVFTPTDAHFFLVFRFTLKQLQHVSV